MVARVLDVMVAVAMPNDTKCLVHNDRLQDPVMQQCRKIEGGKCGLKHENVAIGNLQRQEQDEDDVSELVFKSEIPDS